MKKLQKLTLKQLENEMTLIGSDEQRAMFGGCDQDPPVLIGEATSYYNCHSYAWHNCEGDPTDPGNSYPISKGMLGWDNDPTDDIIEGSYYQKSGSYNPNDKVIYYIDSNNNSIWDVGENIVHSAIIESVDPSGNIESLTSKWGQDGVYRHNLYNTPYNEVDTDNDGVDDTHTKVAVLSN